MGESPSSNSLALPPVVQISRPSYRQGHGIVHRRSRLISRQVVEKTHIRRLLSSLPSTAFESIRLSDKTLKQDTQRPANRHVPRSEKHYVSDDQPPCPVRRAAADWPAFRASRRATYLYKIIPPLRARVARVSADA